MEGELYKGLDELGGRLEREGWGRGGRARL